MTTNIGFIGLGKLGMPVAEAIGKKVTVLGYDITPKHSDVITIVNDVGQMIKDCNIIFIAVQTPHDPEYDGSEPSSHLTNKNFDYTQVADVLRSINPYLTTDKTVVLISTVLPGTVRSSLAPLITNAQFVYNPYLIAMGTVAEDFLDPEMLMIGTVDGDHTDTVEYLITFYEHVTGIRPRTVVGTWEEMECTKIFYNTFISAKLSLVNMIQDVSERVRHINVDIVTDALAKSTKRIMGPAYMKAGMGDGGPCHPRDNIALRWLASEIDLGYDLFDAIMSAREMQARNIALKLVAQRLPISILGKSFKPGVPYTDGSYSMLVGHYCTDAGAAIVYDTILTEQAVYLLAHNIDHRQLLTTMVEGSVVLDPWRNQYTTDGLTFINYGLTR